MGNLIRRCCDDPPSKDGAEQPAKKPSHGKSAAVYPLQDMSQQQTFLDQNESKLSMAGRSPKIEKKNLKLQNCDSTKSSKKKSPAKILPSFLEDSSGFSSITGAIEVKGKTLDHYLVTPEKARYDIDIEHRGVDVNENESIHDSSKIDHSFSRASGGSFNALNSSMNQEKQKKKKKKKKKRTPLGMRKFFGDEYGLHTETTHSRKSNMSVLPTPTPPHNFSKGFFDE